VVWEGAGRPRPPRSVPPLQAVFGSYRPRAGIGQQRQRRTLIRGAATWGYARPEKRKAGEPVPRTSPGRAMRRAASRYSSKVQQRPLTATSTSYRPRPALAGTADKRPAAPLVRDEEAAGSNPATPTQVTGHSPKRDVAFSYAVQQRLRAKLPTKSRRSAAHSWAGQPPREPSRPYIRPGSACWSALARGAWHRAVSATCRGHPGGSLRRPISCAVCRPELSPTHTPRSQGQHPWITMIG
jgi:hypothetical protein